MTSQSPRIYTYKITFEEVPYYYYGVHKEKRFNEYYMGSPVTNKWCWELYTPKKQILEFFEFSDEGYIEAQKVEGRLIRPVYNTDKWCLNESCLGVFSLEQKSKAGKIGGKKNVDEKLGIFGRTKEEIIETGRKSGEKLYLLKLGVHKRSKEQMSMDGKKGGRKGGMKTYELGVGLYAISPEEKLEISRRGGIVGGKVTSSQKWVCTETGYVSTPGGLSRYQKAKGIDTSKRVRIT